MKKIFKTTALISALTLGLANMAYAEFSRDDYQKAAYNFTDISMYTTMVQAQKDQKSRSEYSQKDAIAGAEKARREAVKMVQDDVKTCYKQATSAVEKEKCSYEDNAYANFFVFQDEITKKESGVVLSKKYALNSQTVKWNRTHTKELADITEKSKDMMEDVAYTFSRPSLSRLMDLERTYIFMRENKMFR